MSNDVAAVEAENMDWWRTRIIDMTPGKIAFSGYPIQDLIGNVGFADMVWLMTRGELPKTGQAALLEAALVAGVDHGPQAPSIAIARMAASCGVGINNAMASAVNALGDVHGGAGEQAIEMFRLVANREAQGISLEEALAEWRSQHGPYLPGYGHRFHPVDPRAPRLLELVDRAAAEGLISGAIAATARAIEASISHGRSKPVPMNIDGATAVIYGELGFAPQLARGMFCLSRSLGILAHAWEQEQQGERNKGPLPKRYLWTYDGPSARAIPERE